MALAGPIPGAEARWTALQWPEMGGYVNFDVEPEPWPEDVLPAYCDEGLAF